MRRRTMPQPCESASTKVFGPFVFSPLTGKFTKQGAVIRLAGMPLKVLAHLLDRPGELVSRKELQSLLWTETSYGDFEKGLNSVINLLRNALNDSADRLRYIETVPGQGYRFIAPVRFGEELRIGYRQPTENAATAIVDENDRESSPEGTIALARKKPNASVIAGVLLLLLVSAVLISWVLQP